MEAWQLGINFSDCSWQQISKATEIEKQIIDNSNRVADSLECSIFFFLPITKAASLSGEPHFSTFQEENKFFPLSFSFEYINSLYLLVIQRKNPGNWFSQGSTGLD